MDAADKGQVNQAAARIYEEFFVPALFQQWPEQMLAWAEVGSGHTVLDVGCGTGVLARAAFERVVPGGQVVGLDVNPAMLGVARDRQPEIEWCQGAAEELPFETASFDRIFCQFALMFFEDREQALREMLRALRPGGVLVACVWDALESSPGYAAAVALLDRVVGRAAGDALRAPFCLGDEGRLRQLLDAAGCADAMMKRLPGTARFPSIERWVHTDIKGWTLADLLDAAAYARLQREAPRELGRWAQPDGSVEFPAPALAFRLVKRR